jgi:sodium-dependent dicarboxylate transporter 2/3/5
MAAWWISEALPLAMTALLPLLLFPLTGVLSGADTAAQYFNSTIFLFIGGFMLALAMERWGLHRRIALTVIAIVGTRPASLVLGILLASGLISMWVSNSAVALMMLPIALAVQKRVGDLTPGGATGLPAALMLAVAYGASIGGIGTPVGSPPNLVFMNIYHQEFPAAEPISFLRWTLFATPLMIVLLLICWGLLCLALLRGMPQLPALDLRDERRRLGPTSRQEWAVMTVFALTVLLWLTRAPIDLGAFSLPGWGMLFVQGGLSWVDDGTVAVLASLALFLLPGQRIPGEAPRALLTWDEAQKLPWGIVLLFGGGFALAEGVIRSGLSDWLGLQLQGLAGLSPWLLVFCAYVFTSLLGEIASNTAIAQIVLPIGAALAAATGLAPVVVMLPLTLASSLDFILPSATPPNAIALSSGKLKVRQMVRIGLAVEVAGALAVTAALFTYGGRLLGY